MIFRVWIYFKGRYESDGGLIHVSLFKGGFVPEFHDFTRLEWETQGGE